MPGPGKKQKSRGKKIATASQTNGGHTPSQSTQVDCLTLEEDEMTRCGRPATDGKQGPERCKVHQGQYRKLYKKYKDASKDVDKVKDGAKLPVQEQIDCYTDYRVALEKARWVRKYLEAIRVEKTGREIHEKRFFLKVDDGHRRRLKLLEREMICAVEVLDVLQRRAYDLYDPNGGVHNIVNSITEGLSAAEKNLDLEKELSKSKQNNEQAIESILNPKAFLDSVSPVPGQKAASAVTTPQTGEEDLIQLSLRDLKERMFLILKPYTDLKFFIDLCQKAGDPLLVDEDGRSVLEIRFSVYEQFARRIILHEHALYMKSLGKVSFKDFILSDDFLPWDFLTFWIPFSNPMAFPLKWFKDSVLDALAIKSRAKTAANVGRLENRFPLLGGWVFNRAHTKSMSDEAWWHVVGILQPPGNVENRFVRLCNNFDDLIGFLCFGAFGFVPSPDFCTEPDYFGSNGFDDPRISRGHLSLAGIVVADMGTFIPHQMRGPIPTPQRGTKGNNVIWNEMETRTLMFGAVRNEPDEFVDAFIQELRARPDLFQVVLRSETAPGRTVEMFGSGPSNDEALPAISIRRFEAPHSPFPPITPPSTRDKREVLWSATDVLYGSQKPPGATQPLEGYLTKLERERKGNFFRFKTFPLKYFVILDTVPYREKSILARNVAWAALRAGGYAQGEYTLRKYALASDKLFEKVSKERFGWAPRRVDWSRMENQLNECGL